MYSSDKIQQYERTAEEKPTSTDNQLKATANQSIYNIRTVSRLVSDRS